MFQSLFSNIWAIFLIILFFGGSIFIHELGHYLAARRRGLKVDRFSIGFGPKIFTWKKDGIEYCISLLPLGGYVAIPQLADMGAIEGGTTQQKLPPASYTDKMIVAVMGAVFNVIFAFLLASILWLVGLPMSAQEKTTVIGHVEKQIPINDREEVPGPAYTAGLKSGDRVLAIDGVDVHSFSDIRKLIALGSGRTAQGTPQAIITVSRNNQIQDKTVQPVLMKTNPLSGDYIRILGIVPSEVLSIQAVSKNSPAEKAGLKNGDILLAADKQPLHSLRELSAYLNDHPNQSVQLTIERNKKELVLDIKPQNIPYTKPIAILHIDENQKLELIPNYNSLDVQDNETLTISSSLSIFSLPNNEILSSQISMGDELLCINGHPIHSLKEFFRLIGKKETNTPSILSFKNAQGNEYTVTLQSGIKSSLIPSKTQPLIGIEINNRSILVHENPFKQIFNNLIMTIQTLTSLVNTKTDIHLNHLMGPPGIMRVLHSFSTTDVRLVLWFVVLLNINLAILNLLPIPVLDGGHMLFATISRLMQRPISTYWIANIQGAFMIMLFGLMLYVSFFDVRRWQGDHQTQQYYQKQMALYIKPAFSESN